MGETRVDLLHLLEDLRDAYVGPAEETILTEIVANSLDSGATLIAVTTDPIAAHVHPGRQRRRHAAARAGPLPRHRGEHEDAGRGHRLRGRRDQDGAPALPRGADRDAAARQARGHDVGAGVPPSRAVEVGATARARRRARDGGAPHRRQCALAAAGPGLRRDRAPPPLPAAVRSDLRRDPPRSVSDRRGVHDQRRAARARRADRPGGRADRRPARAAAQADGGRLPDPRPGAAARGSARAGDQHARQGHQARLGLARPHARRSRARGRADRGTRPRGVPHAEQDRLHPRGLPRRHVPGLSKGDPGGGGPPALRVGRHGRERRARAAARGATGRARSGGRADGSGR